MATENILPTGDNTVQFSPSGGGTNFSKVDDPVGSPDDDTTVVLTSTTGNIDILDFANPSAIGVSDTINSVTVHIRARGDQPAFGNVTLRAVLKVGGTNYESGNLVAPLATYTDLSNVWNTNPDTSSAWTLSELNALTGGYKFQSVSGSFNCRVTQCYIAIDYTVAAGGTRRIFIT